MADTELNNLTHKVQILLQSHQKLRTENKLLQMQLAKLEQQYHSLMERNQQATIKIRNIITQLRNQAS